MHRYGAELPSAPGAQPRHSRYPFALYARNGGDWHALPTRVNTIANTVSTELLQLPPDETVWLVACDKGSGRIATGK